MAIKVNLLPREATAARRARPGLAVAMPKLAVGAGLVVQVVTGILILVVVVLAFMAYMASSARSSYAREITQLKVRNDALKTQLAELHQAEAAKAEIQRRIEVIGRVAKSQGVPLATLTGILKSVPQGIWLSSLEMKPQEVKVKIEASRPAAGSEVLGKLDAKKAEVGAAPPPPDGPPVPSGFSTAAIHRHPSTTWDRNAAVRGIKTPQISHNCPGDTPTPSPYPALPRCVISSKCDGPRPAERRMGDRLTVGQRTLTPPV